MNKRRILKEIKTIKSNSPDNIKIFVENDIYNWEAVIIGSKDTFYEDLELHLNIHIPDSYPSNPPVIKFISNVWHPNISQDGEICVSTLKNYGWTPVLTILKTLISINSLLDDPNTDDPLNSEASRMLKDYRNGNDGQSYIDEDECEYSDYESSDASECDCNSCRNRSPMSYQEKVISFYNS